MLRTDYKYALVEEYKNYWNGYQSPDEFYSDLLGTGVIYTKHFARRKMQAKGTSGLCEIKLVDQNTLWFIMYGKSKRALECLETFNQNDIDYACKKERIISSRKIIKIT